jgi:hypothetical protein
MRKAVCLAVVLLAITAVCFGDDDPVDVSPLDVSPVDDNPQTP